MPISGIVTITGLGPMKSNAAVTAKLARNDETPSTAMIPAAILCRYGGIARAPAA